MRACFSASFLGEPTKLCTSPSPILFFGVRNGLSCWSSYVNVELSTRFMTEMGIGPNGYNPNSEWSFRACSSSNFVTGSWFSIVSRLDSNSSEVWKWPIEAFSRSWYKDRFVPGCWSGDRSLYGVRSCRWIMYLKWRKIPKIKMKDKITWSGSTRIRRKGLGKVSGLSLTPIN